MLGNGEVVLGTTWCYCGGKSVRNCMEDSGRADGTWEEAAPLVGNSEESCWICLGHELAFLVCPNCFIRQILLFDGNLVSQKETAKKMWIISWGAANIEPMLFSDFAMFQKPVNNQEFKDSRTNHGVPDFRTLRNINRRKNKVVESSWKNLKSVSKVDMFSYLDSYAFLWIVLHSKSRMSGYNFPD